MRVLVCGSRTFPTPSATIQGVLSGMLSDFDPPPHILVGDCPTGADAEAFDWASEREYRVDRFTADWAAHGRAAGPLRNQAMLDEKPDLVIAFVDKPISDSRGTHDTVKRAHAAGITTLVVQLTQAEW